MDDAEYLARIEEIEAYLAQRTWSYGGRGDLYRPDAQDLLYYLSHCIDADYCGVTRTTATLTPRLRALAAEILAEFDQRWKDRSCPPNE